MQKKIQDMISFTENQQLNLLGCVYYGNPFHAAQEWSQQNEIGLLWGRFMQLAQKYQSLLQKISPNPRVAYEVHIEPGEYTKTRNYYVFVGVEVEPVTEIPLEFYFKPLPFSKYAQFTTKQKDFTIAESFFSSWLGTEKAGYDQNYPFIIQRYDERYKGLEDPDSEIDWLIPIKTLNIAKKENLEGI